MVGDAPDVAVEDGSTGTAGPDDGAGVHVGTAFGRTGVLVDDVTSAVGLAPLWSAKVGVALLGSSEGLEQAMLNAKIENRTIEINRVVIRIMSAAEIVRYGNALRMRLSRWKLKTASTQMRRSLNFCSGVN